MTDEQARNQLRSNGWWQVFSAEGREWWRRGTDTQTTIVGLGFPFPYYYTVFARDAAAPYRHDSSHVDSLEKALMLVMAWTLTGDLE